MICRIYFAGSFLHISFFVRFISALAGRLGIGSRRNFIIRMKCGKMEENPEASDSRMNEIKNRCKEKRKSYNGEDYAFIHCTGYVPVKTLVD